MAKNKVIVEAETLDIAIKKGCEILQVSKDECIIEIINKGKKGVLGLFGENAKVKIIKKENKKDNIDEFSEITNEEEKLFEKHLSDLEEIEESSNVNGYCLLESDKNGIYIIVHPAKESGLNATLDDAQKIIEENEIINIDYNALQTALNETTGEKVKIADFNPELYKPGEVDIFISSDKMFVEISIIPPKGGPALTTDEIIQKLNNDGIVFGIDEDKIDEVVRNGLFNTKVTVCEGIAAINGEDSGIKLKFETDTKKIPSLLEGGKVNFKELNIVTNVLKGELLAEKIHATLGIDGKNVFNETIPSIDGKDIEIIIGKNTELIQNGTQLISKINGQIDKKGNVINVNPIYLVEGDVDYETGNIDFIGNVIVKGSVLDDFEIKAQGNIEVAKAVGAAKLKANGDILVKGGILGKDKGRVEAEGDLFAKFIENSNVIVKGKIVVDKAIMNSTIQAGSVFVGGKKGFIVGGHIKSNEDVVAKTIGSYSSKTYITVGVDEKLLKRINDIDDEISEIYKRIDKLSNAVAMLIQLKQRIKNLPEEKEKILSKSIKTKENLEIKVEELEELKEDLDVSLEQSKGGKIRIKDIVYPGTYIKIRKGTYVVKDSIKFVSFVYNKGFVEIQPYE